MANILSRFKDIMESNVHALLDKCEDPEKMLDQNLRKALDDLVEVKQSTAEVMAAEKSAKRKYDEALRAAEAEHECAANALKAGDEEAARKFLASESQIRSGRLAAAEKTWKAAKANADQMKEMHNKLADDIEWMQSELSTIKGTIRVAKATETVGRAKGIKNDSRASFTKYADKAQQMLDEAQAKAELAEEPRDEMDDLRAKYSSGGSGTAGTDDALAALRAEINGGNG